MPTERKTKPGKKPASSSTATKKKKAPVAAKTRAKARKTTASKRRVVKPAQPKVSKQPSASEQPILGRDLIVSATKIAIGTKQKAGRLLKVASDFFTNRKASGKSVIQEIGNSPQVRRVIEFAEVIPKKVKEFNQHRKSTK